LQIIMNATTNVKSLSSATSRFFVEGSVLPPAAPPRRSFLVETARDYARWDNSWAPMQSDLLYGTRFTLTEETKVDEVASWLTDGQGTIFAAILSLPNPSANPLPPNHPNFMNTVVGTTLIRVGDLSDEYTGNFGGLTLHPGSYALMLGRDRFGASGTAGIMGVSDQFAGHPSIQWTGSGWFTTPNPWFRLALHGVTVPEPGTIASALLGLVGIVSMRRRGRVS
jgi:hypothetical protein